jgi:hypothetical protein
VSYPDPGPGTPYEQSEGDSDSSDGEEEAKKASDGNPDPIKTAIALIAMYGPAWAQELLSWWHTLPINPGDVDKSVTHWGNLLYRIFRTYPRITIPQAFCEAAGNNSPNAYVAWLRLLEELLHELRHVYLGMKNGDKKVDGPDNGHPANEDVGVEEGNDPNNEEGGSGKDGWGEKDKEEAKETMKSAGASVEHVPWAK